ncbi:MAG: Hpt domain-containing protein [Deltaproteobacteria bacterium]|nr:Hpt domain-containing protein [Deltaproteobacteria bacterium]
MSDNPIDIAELSDILGTADPSVLCPIFEVWLEASLPRVEAISSAADARDRTLLRQAAHGAKGTALQIGAKQMAKMCAQIDVEVAAGSWEDLLQLVGEILDENECARCFVKSFLARA